MALTLTLGANLYLPASAAVAAPSCTANPMMASTPSGSTVGYTLFTTGDAIMANSELEGSLAVGGTATFGDTRGDTSAQYAIFHGGVGGNASYAIPKTDGDSTRVLLNKYAPGNVNKIVQVKADGLVSDPGLVKLVSVDSPSGYTFRKDFGSSGTTFWPSTGNNQSAQLASFVQPWTGTTDTSADGVAAAKASFQTKGSFGSYFPTDQGQSILAGVTGWKVPTVTGSGDVAVTLDLSGPNRLALADLGSAQKFHFQDGITYSPCAPLVIKVSASDIVGGTLTLPSFAGAGKSADGIGISYILWDLSGLSGTVSITSPNEPVRGAIYAPNANIVFPSDGREFEGQLIAKQLTALQAGKEIHTNLFAGRFAPALVPALSTSVAVTGSAAKVLPVAGGSVVDTVSYSGLTVGTSYVVSGELMTAAGVGTGITASATFTPTASSGTVEVGFSVSAAKAELYAGQKLVVFESLATSAAPTVEVAKHQDLTDAAQTLSVAAASFAIGDVVWIDTDRDGVQDAGEQPLAGVTVRLLTAGVPSVLATTTTDAQGRYLFDELAAGSYRIQFELTDEQAAEYAFTTADQGADDAADSDGIVGGDPQVATTNVVVLDGTDTALTRGYSDQSVKATFGIDPTWDAGVVTDKVSVGDWVWLDANRDGLQSAGENPVAGVQVRLWPGTGVGDGSPLATTVTDSAGYYSFTGLTRNADYTIEFVKPDGMSWTVQNAGGASDNNLSTDTSDSDVAASGLVSFTAAAFGTNSAAPGAADNPGIDAGLVEFNLSLTKTLEDSGPYAPGDQVAFYLTPHNDGPADALAGWSVTDLLPTGLEAVSIAGTAAGDYTCELSSLTCVASGPLVAGADGPKVLVKAKVKAGVTGKITNVAYLSPVATDVAETNALVIPVAGDDTTKTATDNDAHVSLTIDQVSFGDHTWWDTNRNGQQDAGEKPVAGVTVTLVDADGAQVGQTVTDADGYYYFADLLPKTTYTVKFGLPQLDGADDPAAAFTKAGIGDARSDSNADPATGLATVTTTASGANLHGSGSSDEDDPTIDAGYVKYNLSLTKESVTAAPFRPGQQVEYKLVPHNDGPVDALAGWQVTEVLPAGLNLVSMDGGSAYECAAAVCTAKASLAAEADGPTITVTATIADDFTGVAKNVAYVQPAADDVAEASPLGADAPTSSTDTATTATDNDAQASLSVAPVSIGDFVWYDNDRDGVRDAAEPGVPAVTVNLYRGTDASGAPVAATDTDSQGHYSFTGLLPGTTYTLEFIKPDGVHWTVANAAGGGADADLVDSDVSAAGLVTLTTPLTGDNAGGAGEADDHSLDAGVVSYNLRLAKHLDTTSTVYLGDTVEFTLTPHNDGPSFALAGWGVTEVLPDQLELVSMAPAQDPADYRCAEATCVASRPLAAGADGPAVKVTAKVVRNLSGAVKNVAYVFPNDTDVAESVGLVRPADASVDTQASATDNDAEAPVQVTSLVSIGDHVWLDANRDGQQDEASPLAAVTVNLYAKDGTSPIASRSTDATGFYSFTDLRPSTDYRVEFVAPAGYALTSQSTGDGSGDSNPNALGVAAVTTPASGGNSPTAPDDPTIDAGFVRYNLSVTKQLISRGPFYERGQVTYQVTPSNSGPAAALAGWSVTEVPQAGLTITGMDGGSDYSCGAGACVSSTALAAGASAAPITVTAVIDDNFVGKLRNLVFVSPARADVAETNPLSAPENALVDPASTATDNDAAADLSVDSLVSEGDYVWWDNNRDGLRSEGEPGVPGLTVRLLDADGGFLRSTTTDQDGRYFFDDLVPGATYQVEFVRPSDAAFTATDGGDGGAGDSVDSDADQATGRATFVAAGHGSNLTGKGEVDTPAVDAGLVKYNLQVSKRLATIGELVPNQATTFVLTPHNEGPATALAGWSITDLLPQQTVLVAAYGDGYTCTNATCVNSNALAGGADGPVLTVVVKPSGSASGEYRNIAYIAPSGQDVAESIALQVPNQDTDTEASATDNDAQAQYAVAGVEDEPKSGDNGGSLAFTGASGLLPTAVLGLALLAAGAMLVRLRRRES